MNIRLPRRYAADSPTAHERGQVLIIFAGAFVVICIMLGLLFDGARGVVMRRQVQDASDAASLAAANVLSGLLPRTCSATGTTNPGAPQAAVIAAAQASVAKNLPGYNPLNVAVSCPNVTQLAAMGLAVDMVNSVVRVDLTQTSPTYFGSVAGITNMQVGTTSLAVNGRGVSAQYSVVVLDPYNVGPSPKYNGCPAVLFSGSNTITFQGSMQVNSACPANGGGALGTNGNSAILNFFPGKAAYLTGGYAPGPLVISPPPVTGSSPIDDPLAALPTINFSALANRSVPNGNIKVLDPGIYRGGIQLKNSEVAFLHPGIYVMQDDNSGRGGFTIGAQNKVYSIPSTIYANSNPPPSNPYDSNPGQWATDCPVTVPGSAGTCGVLLYNQATSNDMSGSSKDPVNVNAGATLKLRPYNDQAAPSDLARDAAYNYLLLWQDKNPQPTMTYEQPAVALSGGGNIDISGTVYAPSAKVTMGGNSGGSGGSAVNITLQFISWDLEFNGGPNFDFIYDSDKFASTYSYGLVK